MKIALKIGHRVIWVDSQLVLFKLLAWKLYSCWINHESTNNETFKHATYPVIQRLGLPQSEGHCYLRNEHIGSGNFYPYDWMAI